LLIGIPGALAAGRLIESQLFGVHASDSSIIIASAAALTLAVMLAAYLPARRAASIDPLEALRSM
jgi:macrolide transport system ATP-binding/permease protein